MDGSGVAEKELSLNYSENKVKGVRRRDLGLLVQSAESPTAMFARGAQSARLKDEVGHRGWQTARENSTRRDSLDSRRSAAEDELRSEHEKVRVKRGKAQSQAFWMVRCSN